MWIKLRPHFEGFPAQEKVAQLMVQMGFRVFENRVFAGPVEVSDTALARAAGVDRRVVTATTRTIERNADLKRFFERLAPVCHLREVASLMGWGAVEIIPTSASKPAILCKVFYILTRTGSKCKQFL